MHLIDGMRGRTRAFVQVQNGCDHRCTFCIIPYGRGNSRSVPMGAVVEQVRTLVEHGSREVVLTGVDITSYGKDLPGEPKLGALVKSILRHVPELERLRISSIDSVEADRDLLDAIAGEPRLMPHLHLSLQAGRRPRAEAHEAPASARRRDRLLRRSPPPAAGHRLRRRHHRRLPDRDGRDVRSAPSTSSRNAVSRIFTSSRSRRARARRPRACRRSRATVVKERARRLREKGEAALRAASRRRGRRAPQACSSRPRSSAGRKASPSCASPPRSAPARSARSTIAGHDGKELLAA